MDLSFEALEKHFDVRQEEAALFFIFLTLIPPGEHVSFLNGRIEKLTDDTFQLCVDTDTLHEIADNFLIETVNDYTDIFPAFDNEEDGEESQWSTDNED